MSFWKYKYFVDVVECKSFTKAGKKNYVSQTAISQQIADLERKIGGKLLYRDRGVLILTELGEIVYKRAKEILFINAQLEKEIENFKKSYVIKIGIDSSINKLLWEKMQKMLDTYYEEEDFQFSRIDFSVGTTLLEEGALDIYIGYGLDKPNEIKEIDSFVISSHETGVYLGKNSTVPRTDKIMLKDLKGYKRYETKSYPCSILKIDAPQFDEICSTKSCVDNVETMRLKVEFNDGYAFVDSHYFSHYDGIIYPIQGLDISQEIHVFYKKREREKSKVNDVLSKIKLVTKE